jgi:hypothetical protein
MLSYVLEHFKIAPLPTQTPTFIAKHIQFEEKRQLLADHIPPLFALADIFPKLTLS